MGTLNVQFIDGRMVVTDEAGLPHEGYYQVRANLESGLKSHIKENLALLKNLYCPHQNEESE